VNNKNLKNLAKKASEKSCPLFVVAGNEEFLREEAIEVILKNSIPEKDRGLHASVFYADDVNGEELYNSITSYSMFSPHKVIVIRGCNKLKSNATNLLISYIESPADSTVIIFEAEKLPAKNVFFKKLKEKACIVEFKKLYERQIPAWITDRVSKQGKKITEKAVSLLFDYIGLNLRQIANEIDKCILYIKDRDTIEEDDIANIVGIVREYNIFELRNAVGEKKIFDGIRIITKMIELGESLPGIIVRLTMYFNMLGKIVFTKTQGKSLDELRSQLGIHPFFWKETIKQAKNFSEDSLKRCFETLLDADYKAKTGFQNDETIATIMIYHLCKA